MIPSVLAWLVIGLELPLFWLLAFFSWRLSRRDPSIESARVVTLLLLHLAIVVTIFAAVFLNNGMAKPILDPFGTMVLTRLALLDLSIPAIRIVLFLYGGRK